MRLACIAGESCFSLVRYEVKPFIVMHDACKKEERNPGMLVPIHPSIPLRIPSKGPIYITIPSFPSPPSHLSAAALLRESRCVKRRREKNKK